MFNKQELEFSSHYTGGHQQIDVPPGVRDLLRRVEKGIELVAMTRNTFAKPPGPEDAAMLAELGGIFPEIDQAVQADLNAIAVAVRGFGSQSDSRARQRVTK